MKRPFDEELISAYLDGELTADEQSRVEEALASDARLRQLHDDLRALRNGLQSLPQQKLDGGFVDRVLRAAAAAQRKPGGEISSSAVSSSEVNGAPPAGSLPRELHPDLVSPPVAASGSPPATTPAPKPVEREPLVWRAVVVAVASLAAALIIALALPGQFGEVALGPDMPAPIQPEVVTGTNGVERSETGANTADNQLSLKKASGDAIPDQAVSGAADDGTAGNIEKAALDKANDRVPARELQMRSDVAGVGNAKFRGQAADLRTGGTEAEALGDAANMRRNARDATTDGAQKQKSVRGLAQLGQLLRQQGLRQQELRKSAQPQNQHKELASQAAEERAEDKEKNAHDEADRFTGEADEPLLVVRLTAGVDSHEIDQLLAKHNIQLATTADRGLARPFANSFADNDQGIASAPGGGVAAPDAAAPGAVPLAVQQEPATTNRSTDALGVVPAEQAKRETLALVDVADVDLEAYAAAQDVMVVVAAPTQIEGFVQALAAREADAEVSIDYAKKFAERGRAADPAASARGGASLQAAVRPAPPAAKDFVPRAGDEAKHQAADALGGDALADDGKPAEKPTDLKRDTKLAAEFSAAGESAQQVPGYAQRLQRQRTLPPANFAESSDGAGASASASARPQALGPRVVRPQAGRGGYKSEAATEAAPALTADSLQLAPPPAPAAEGGDGAFGGGGRSLTRPGLPHFRQAPASSQQVRILLVIERPTADATPATPAAPLE